MSCDTLPSEMMLHAANRALQLQWDGRRASVPYARLRAACRCSVCESLRRKTHADPAVEQDVALVDIAPVGSVGVQLFFSDDHDRGIYPWAYLHELAFGSDGDGAVHAVRFS
ncbi:DUF971 domain-containing protein [Oxalicibacterium solurbis]|uniref:Gamma-butyrobetaine hydroxylase-like N-terminal domain-containing protein n=1 Tax=Oxalicibacterium solurbis TaxID=69280 RepID=A0A8J3AX11_9BURK|nr:gamma-butyrobetaine hydroxylase-like domain-containing protein [Oxalicibacterium solurbis]GGI54770.1 hypothetical protein GCM10011430_19440 [Oxalicibacterium solurbis]